ncbi:MAG: AraC family transcriptional regulator [Terrimicrobiaceae bacterium]
MTYQNPVKRSQYPEIQTTGDNLYSRVRDFYLAEEARIVQAIRRGDRPEAVAAINRVLVHVYAKGGEDSDALKGLLLELVVMMSRAAADAGASQEEILGNGYEHLVELSRVQDDEELAVWLRHSFDRIMAAVGSGKKPDAVLSKTMAFLRDHCSEHLTRSWLARHVGVSESHLASLLKDRLGQSFTELLQQVRLDKALEQLRGTDAPIADIAAACGFSDQSHLTRIMRQLKGYTPRHYRAASSAGGDVSREEPGV